jgi:Kef-type K+ transport system membrane component KefB
MPADDLTAAAAALRRLPVEDLLVPVLVQLAVIVAAARVGGALARRVRQPAVVGEIVAGLLLGPSLFGWLTPDAFRWLFKPDLPGVPADLTAAAYPKIFEVLKELGLIFLLFLIGLEFEFSHLKAHGRAAVAISVVGVVVPFALGAGLAPVIHPHLEPHPTVNPGRPVPLFAMTLFMGVAMSITAIPILGRMMIEMGINRTKLGAVVITAAAVDDACGWVLLATVAALARAEYDPVQTLTMVGLTVGFAGFVFVAARPLLVRYFRHSLAANGGQLSLNALAVLIVCLLLSAVATGRIGIFAIFGAFLLGAALSDQAEFRAAVTARLRDFVTGFFLPIFFTYTGLRTQVGSLSGPTLWVICGGVLAAAVVGKLVGCGVTARLCGMPAREAGIVGVMMNTRALMELIVVNVGFQIGVIPPSLFTMLVVMAVVTTVMTTPVLLALRRGTEIEAPIAASGFLSGSRG